MDPPLAAERPAVGVPGEDDAQADRDRDDDGEGEGPGEGHEEGASEAGQGPVLVAEALVLAPRHERLAEGVADGRHGGDSRASAE